MRYAGLSLGIAILVGCAPVEPGLGVEEDALVVCGRGPTVPGIDVSSWQGTIDWPAVAASGVQFAIVRIGDGTFRDSRFAANWAGARAAGLLRGSYQYFRPSLDPIAQADIVVAAVGVLGPGDMPVSIDVEAPMPTVTPAQYTAAIHAWVDRVTAGTGRTPMIYTGRYYWDPYVASSDFVTLPLWHPQYTTASCPNINDRWSDWAIWQYSSTGSVPGIAGNVDMDRWNGTYEELQAFAHVNQPPTGTLEAAACAGIAGWAQDPDVPTTPIDVDVWIDGAAGDPGALRLPVHANVSRPDLCTALGSCEHAFTVLPPPSFFDGAVHPVHAYALDAMGGPGAELTGSPQTFQCDAPPVPMPPGGAVKRRVSAAAMAAWQWTPADVVPLSDAMLAAFPDGPELSPAPDLVQVSGDPAVYLREYEIARRVPDAAAMAAWRLDPATARTIDAATLAADVRGVDLFAAPFLAQGSGEIYLVDAAPPLWAEPTIDTTPARMMVGTATDVVYRFRNRGSIDWAAGEIALAPLPRDVGGELCDPTWPSCTRAAAVDALTVAGDEGHFRVRLRAPMATGPVEVCWNLTLGGHWFSDPGQGGPPDGSFCRTIEIVSTIDPGAMPGAGGCGCRAGSVRGGGPLWLAALGLLLVLRRRRSRQ